MKIIHSKETKYFAIMFAVVVFCINAGRVSAHQFTNYFGIQMNMEEYMTLLNLGFTDDEIYYMDEDTFFENKDLDAELVAQSNKYYKIVTPMYGTSYVVEVTENEYLNHPENSLLGYVTTVYINEISSISANGSKYRYKNTVGWLNIPTNKSYDVIAIGFTNSVYINSSVYFKYATMDSAGNWHNSTLYYDKKNTSTGGSAVYKIPSELYGLSAMIYFDVSKNTTDTLDHITMCGDYAHSFNTVTSSQAASHAVNSGGIDFDGSVYSLFNEIPCASETAWITW